MTGKAKAAMGPVATAAAFVRHEAYPVPDEARGVEDLTARLTSLEHELDAERKSHDADRQKLRKLEHLLLVAEKDRAGKSRSEKITLTLAGTGITAVVTMTPLCFLQLFGVLSQGAYGYVLSILLWGASLIALVASPASTRLIRFLGAFFPYIAMQFACMYGVMGTLALTDVFCGAWDEGVCDLVAIGMLAAGAVLVLVSAAWAWMLRLIPGSERVPLSQLRKRATPKMGRFLATVATFAAAPVLWALYQPDESFVLSPRKSLLRLWLLWRLGNLGWGLIWTTVPAVAYGRGHADVPVVPSLLAHGCSSFAIAFFMTVKNRGRVHNWLGSLGSSEETRAAALLAAVVGGMDAKQAFESAQRAFSGISFDVLSIDDFTHSRDLAGKEVRDLDLKARTTHGLKLGEVDAFLSHSWRDDPHAKWATLEAWAANFAQRRGGASPMLWLDKACIDQQNISASLACLPVFLSGCKQLLIVPGPTYVHRLWCVMEVFTFIFMGGDLSRITVLPIRDDRTAAVVPLHGGDKVADQESVVVGIAESVPRPTGSGSFVDRSDLAARAVLDKFATFDAEEASCYLPDDKQMILGVIETGIGSVEAFNELVRTTFAVGKAAVGGRRNLTRSSSQTIVIGMETSGKSSDSHA